jgi:hypothetical protein
MSDRITRRLGGHLRRNGISYAALAGVLALSPVPSMAADLVTTDEIANGAVTGPKLATGSVYSFTVADGSLKTADIKDGNVTYDDLSTSARGAKLIRYDVGSNDFSTIPYFAVQLPGAWDSAQLANSTWTGSMFSNDDGLDHALPGFGFARLSEYQISVSPTGFVYIELVSGPGESYASIRIYQHVVTAVRTIAPTSRVKHSSTESPGR